MWQIMKIYLSLSTAIFWIITRLFIFRWGCEALFHLRWGAHPAAAYGNEILTHATFIHGYFIYWQVPAPLTLSIISFMMFSVPHRLWVWQAAVSPQSTAAGTERSWCEQVNRKNIPPFQATRKGHKIEAGRMEKDKRFADRREQASHNYLARLNFMYLAVAFRSATLAKGRLREGSSTVEPGCCSCSQFCIWNFLPGWAGPVAFLDF